CKPLAWGLFIAQPHPAAFKGKRLSRKNEPIAGMYAAWPQSGKSLPQIIPFLNRTYVYVVARRGSIAPWRSSVFWIASATLRSRQAYFVPRKDADHYGNFNLELEQLA
ncbi:MAG: hypothetical protein LBH14_01805, partial [Desulfobulbaceae bacterium]|nr:hypothetical protein [Desulfobulbaceae bacterium]